ncbi:hypothetical protein VQ056_05070 [Paenibacillus sp. JTLBN-2024]
MRNARFRPISLPAIQHTQRHDDDIGKEEVVRRLDGRLHAVLDPADLLQLGKGCIRRNGVEMLEATPPRQKRSVEHSTLKIQYTIPFAFEGTTRLRRDRRTDSVAASAAIRLHMTSWKKTSAKQKLQQQKNEDPDDGRFGFDDRMEKSYHSIPFLGVY